MIDLNLRISPTFSFQEALFLGKKAHLRTLGLLISDLTITAFQVAELKKQIEKLALFYDLNTFLGFCIECVPTPLIPSLTVEAREKGFDYIAVAGEALCSDFFPGTNLAAVEAGADIILHAGYIDSDLAQYIKEKNIALEYNTHPLYSHSNPLLAHYAWKFNIPLVWGSSISCKEDFAYLEKRPFFPLISTDTEPKLLIKKINEDTLGFINHLKA